MTLYGSMTLSGATVRRKKTSSFDQDEAKPARPALLLEWYDRHRRKLPWRPLAGERADPYRVWLSEIMLQQTGVKTVGPYFLKFLARWPDVDALGRASLDDVLRMWAGSAIIRGRAICTPARWRCGAIMAARFPTPRKVCARC